MLHDLTRSPIGSPVAWEPLRHNLSNQATGGIWRVTGDAGTAILKHAVRHGDGTAEWQSSDDPRHWNYWKRECGLYADGTITAYCAGTGLAAPELLDIATRPDGSLELWLEDVHGAPGHEWSIDRLAAFARQLGRAQAHAVHMPEGTSHSRQWLRQYAGRLDIPQIPWNHPTAATRWPQSLRDGLRIMWERRTALFDLAERFPQTTCHLDVWPMNLIAPCSESVLLDWSFLGRGAIGEDPANLIADTFLDGLQPTDLLPGVRDSVTESYLDGLTEAGWHGDHDTVRNAIAATGAAKYVWLAPMMLRRLEAGQPVGSASYDPHSEIDEVFARRTPVFEMLVSWARHSLDA